MEELFRRFLRHVQLVVNQYHEEQGFPQKVVGFGDGRAYWRVYVVNGSQQSVYCFVRKSDGAIFRGASWCKPDKKVRGTLDNYEDTILGGYAVTYVNGQHSYGPNTYPKRPD